MEELNKSLQDLIKDLKALQQLTEQLMENNKKVLERLKRIKDLNLKK